MSSYLNRIVKDRKRGRLPYRETKPFRVVPDDEYVPPESPVVLNETWDESEERRRAKRRKSLMGTARLPTTIPMREPLAETNENEVSLSTIRAQNKQVVETGNNIENIPFGTQQHGKQIEEIAKSVPEPSLSSPLTQQDNIKASSTQQQSQVPNVCFVTQGQIVAETNTNANHQPPAERKQQEKDAGSSDDELSIHFDMDIEEKEAPIVDKTEDLNDQEMTAVPPKSAPPSKEKTPSPPSKIDQVTPVTQEKEVIDLDQEMVTIEQPAQEKPVSPSKDSNVASTSKNNKVASPKRQVTEDEAMIPESDAPRAEPIVAEQEKDQENIQQETVTNEKREKAPSPLPYIDDDNYSIDFYDPGDDYQVESEQQDEQPSAPAEIRPRDKGKRRAVEINPDQSTPPREQVTREFSSEALESKQRVTTWLKTKRGFDYVKETRKMKLVLAVLECVLSAVFFTGRDVRDNTTSLQQQSIVDGYYESYRIFMERLEALTIKYRQAVIQSEAMKRKLKEKKDEEVASRAKLGKLKRDVEEAEKKLEKLKEKHTRTFELDNIFTRIKNKSKRNQSAEE